MLQVPSIPPPASQPSPPMSSNSEEVKVILQGSPRAIANEMHILHIKGYAEIGRWSPLQPTGKAGEFISVLIRFLAL